MKNFNLLTVLALLVLLLYVLSGCKGTCIACTKEPDTGVYYTYQAKSVITGRTKLVMIDFNWNVYDKGDTVYIDKQGFVVEDYNKLSYTQASEDRTDAVVLEQCTGAISILNDNTVLWRDTNIRPPVIEMGTSD